MKIDEFIEKVNDRDGMQAKMSRDCVVVGSKGRPSIYWIPKDATNWIEIDTWATSNILYWQKPGREYLSALINEFLETPIKDRFPEKKWHLNMGQDEYGNDIYLMNVVGSPKQLRTSLAVSNEFTTFTDSDLVKLKEQYPRLAPAIDAMKEPVEDDDEQK